MKKILATLMVFAFMLTVIDAKDMKGGELTSLKSDIESYKKATMNGDVDKLIDYVYPTVFKLMPKDVMIKQLKAAYSSGMMPKINKMEIVKIYPIQKFDKGEFTTVDYTMNLDMDSSKMPKEIKSKMLDMLKSKLGSKSKVTQDDKNNLFHIEKFSTMYAIKEGNSSWKFIEKDQTKMLKTKKLLPAQIAEKL